MLRSRREPEPLAPTAPDGEAPHVGRLRAALSEWYYGDRVDVEEAEPEVSRPDPSPEALER